MQSSCQIRRMMFSVAPGLFKQYPTGKELPPIAAALPPGRSPMPTADIQVAVRVFAQVLGRVARTVLTDASTREGRRSTRGAASAGAAGGIDDTHCARTV